MDSGAVICKRGHVCTSYLKPGQSYDKVCETCGQSTLVACEKCSTPLRGVSGLTLAKFEPPRFCRECGTAYPWTSWKAQQIKGTLDTYSVGVLTADETASLKNFADEVVNGEASDLRVRSAVGLIIEKFGAKARILLDGLTDVGTSVIAKVIAETIKSHGG